MCAILLCSLPAAAVNAAQIYPESGLYFGFQATGTTSPLPQTISIYNTTTTAITVNSLSIAPSQFMLVSGATPVTISPGGYANFTLSSTPDSAKNFSGTITFTFTGLPDQSAHIVGIGTSTTAKASLNTTSLNFGNQALGSVATAQTVTITNTGTTTFNITGVTITQPFLQTGYSGRSIAVAPNASASLLVFFSPSLLGAAVGTLLVSYDVLPNSGVSLSGTASAATGFGVTTFPTLPAATQSAAYEAVLTAAGGHGTSTWSLASGSTLPAGLTLTSGGMIKGTLTASVGTGSYAFTAQATDHSGPPKLAIANLTLPVGQPTGANCNNIAFKQSGTQNNLVPLIDLGTNYYQGIYQGGLYANGITGYSNGVYNLYHEPYAYEAGFGTKLAIHDQINGNANLNFDPSKGSVLAPWMAWGPYYWANGLLPRADGLVWSCQDSLFDGTHPSSFPMPGC